MQNPLASLPIKLSGRPLLADVSRTAKIAAGALLAAFLGLWSIFHGHFNLVAAAIYLALFLLIALWNRPLSLVVVAGYTFLLGDLRRILDIAGDSPTFDPLILVSPVFSLLIVGPILLHLKLRDPIQKAILALMAIMMLEVVNPIQGPLIVGLGGALSYLVPLCWFWLGWQYGSLSLLKRLFSLVVWLGVLAAILGIIQTYVGYLPWQQSWLIRIGSHIHSMYLAAGRLRAVGFSVNGVEFTSLLVSALVSSLALFLSGKRTYLLLTPILAFGLFLASSRTSIVFSLFGVTIAWAVSSRNSKLWLPRFVLAIAVGVAAIGFSVTRAANEQAAAADAASDDSAVAASTKHQVQGLAHPLDSKHSTAGLHGRMLLGGFVSGFTNPIGRGLGSTFAGAKLGGDSSSLGSSEVDLSDMFITNGLIGGCLYFYIIVLVYGRVTYLVKNAKRDLALPTAGVLAALSGTWLIAGRYGITTWVWLVIGVVCSYGSKAKMLRQNEGSLEQPLLITSRPTPSLPF